MCLHVNANVSCFGWPRKLVRHLGVATSSVGCEDLSTVNIIPAALPARDFGEIFPTVDELVEGYVEDDPGGKLYLRAEIEELPALSGVVSSDRWNVLVRQWSEHIVGIDALVRASGMGLEEVLPVMEGEFLPYTESGLWSACQSILDDHDDRQAALSSESADAVMDVIERALEAKRAQMDVIRFMMESE